MVLFLYKNFNEKEGKIILLITKQEAFELKEKYGHKFGSEQTLHHTYTKNHKYYMTESRKAMADLSKIRNEKVKFVRE